MKQQLQIQVTSQKPFGNGFMNFAGNTPTGTIEGISWEAANHHYFTPGNRLLIEVGQDKSKDGAAFTEYKGKSRLEVTKTAQIAFASQEAPQAATPYQAPSYQPAAAPQPHSAPLVAVGGRRPQAGERQPLTREEILDLGCEDVVRVYNNLAHQGLPEELVIRAAASAPTWAPLNWFGEKSC